MIESQYGDKTFPSFVKWLVGWRVDFVIAFWPTFLPHFFSFAIEYYLYETDFTPGPVGWQAGYPHSTSSAKEAHEAHRELTKTCVRTLTKIRRWPVPWTLTGTSCNRGCFYTAHCCLPYCLHFVFNMILIQMFLLCTKLQGHRQIWDVPTGFEVNCPYISRIATEYDRARYIGYTANVTFNEGVQENRTGKRTSSRALSFFKQVYSYYAEWYFTVCPPSWAKKK